ALPHNILARILFDRAVPSVLSCGRIRGWSPLKDDCCKNGCYPFHVVPFNCSCSDATNRCSACHCSGRQSRRVLPDRFPVLLKKNHPQSSDSSGSWRASSCLIGGSAAKRSTCRRLPGCMIAQTPVHRTRQ